MPENFVKNNKRANENALLYIFSIQTPFQFIFFFAEKIDEKQINRDFIKGGRGGHHFMK